MSESGAVRSLPGAVRQAKMGQQSNRRLTMRGRERQTMRHLHWGLALVGICISIGLTGCGGKQAEIKEDRLTVGRVQGEVKVGMSAAQVAELLGSPNIVTTDDKRREVWIYDKVSTDRVDTASSTYAGLIILGANSSNRSSSQRQRTLTIIIKYDEDKKVRDFAYNSTQF